MGRGQQQASEAAMDKFIRRQNVDRYHNLLKIVTSDEERQKIQKLLAEEQQKQKDADDPIAY